MPRTGVRSTFVYAAGLLFQQVCIFAGTVLSARWLGPADYGLLSVIRNVFSIVLLIAPLGLDLALQKHLSNPEQVPTAKAQVTFLARRVWIVNAVFAIALAVGSIPIFSSVYARQDGSRYFALFLVALPFAAQISMLGAVYRAFGDVSRFAISSLFLQPAVRVALIGALLALGFGISGVVAANVLAVVASNLLLWASFRTLIRSGDPLGRESSAAARQALALGLPMAGSLLLYGMLRNVDVVILGAVASTTEVAHYSLLSALAQLVLAVPQAMSQMMGPAIAEFHWRADRSGMAAYLEKQVRLLSIAAAIPCAMLAAFAPWFNLFTGPKYEFSSVVSLVLALAYFVSAVWGPVGYSLSMTGSHRSELKLIAATVLVTLILCAGLGRQAGQEGVAIAMLVGYVILNFGRMALAKGAMGISVLRASQITPLLLLLAWTFPVRLFAESALPRSVFSYGAVVAVATFGALFLTYMFLLETPDRERLTKLFAGTRA